MDAVVAAIRKEIKGRSRWRSGSRSSKAVTPTPRPTEAIAGDPAIGCEHGASDARFLSAFGIPGIVWGADGDNSAHAVDEHVNIDSLLALHKILDDFLTGLL